MNNKNKWPIAISGAIALAAVAIYLIRKSDDAVRKRPPRRAPQLHLHNPGTQDEFPVAASESEVG